MGPLKEYVESVHEESIYSCPHCGFKENGVRNLKHHVDAVQKKRVPSVNSINNITNENLSPIKSVFCSLKRLSGWVTVQQIRICYILIDDENPIPLIKIMLRILQ